ARGRYRHVTRYGEIGGVAPGAVAGQFVIDGELSGLGRFEAEEEGQAVVYRKADGFGGRTGGINGNGLAGGQEGAYGKRGGWPNAFRGDQGRLGPGRRHEGEGLHETITRAVGRYAQSVKRCRMRAAPDAEIEPSAALPMELGDLLGKKQRVVKRKDDDRCADTDAFGSREDRGGEKQGGRVGIGRLLEMEFVEPDAIIAQRIHSGAKIQDGTV